MKIKFDIQIIFKDKKEKPLSEQNCSEYGMNNGGTAFYFVRKKKVEDTEILEDIKFVSMDKIDNVNILRKSIFETKKEKLEFIKNGGLTE